MHKRLHLKGWSAAEIIHAKRIFAKAQANKHPHVRFVEESLYWLVFCVGLLGNLLLSVILIPVFIVSKSQAYFFTGLLGFLFGALMIIILKDMNWLVVERHLLLSLVVPLVGIFNFFIVVRRSNLVSFQLGLQTTHDPVLVGITYFLCFAMPYVLFLGAWRKQR